jgi:hypothetical protein
MWAWIALIAVGYLAVRRFFAGYPGPGLRTLAPREAAFVAAAADALFPTGGAVTPSGVDAGVPEYIDRWVSAVPARVRLLMRLLFVLVEHATLVLPAPGPRGWRRFSSLSHEQQVAALDGWRGSRLFPRRVVFLALRSTISMAYFADPTVLRQLGLAPYDFPTPVCEADLLWPRAGRPRSEIRWTRADLTPPSDGTPLPLDGPIHPDFRPGGQGAR